MTTIFIPKSIKEHKKKFKIYEMIFNGFLCYFSVLKADKWMNALKSLQNNIIIIQFFFLQKFPAFSFHHA